MVNSNLPRSNFPFMSWVGIGGLVWAVGGGRLVVSRRCNMTQCICEILGEVEGGVDCLHTHTHTHTHTHMTD